MWDGTIGMLYRCMDEINNIAEEMRKLKGDLEKQEKINEIAKNSAKTWLKEVMKNQTYSYYTTEDENKIMLSIKMKNRVQLDIPIYYKRFQKIIPKLLETIQQFENTANKSNVKVLISNSRHNQQWETK
jgi:Tfp pilus assembly pilus retraction ATPase PilT